MNVKINTIISAVALATTVGSAIADSNQNIKNENFSIEKQLYIGNMQIKIRAKQPIDISVLLPKKDEIEKMNIDDFVATFDKERLTYFPDEEISLEIEESDKIRSKNKIMPQASGTLYVNAKWGWNTVLRQYQYAEHYSLYGKKGIAIFTQPLYGQLHQWDLVCGQWRFMRTSNGAGTWASTWVGCDSGYGSKVQCISSGGCKAHLLTFIYN